MLVKRYYDDVASLRKNYADPFNIFDDYGRTLDLLGTAQSFLTAENFYRTEKTDTGIKLSVDLPGVKAEDLDVTLEGRTLRIKGIQRGKQVSYSYLISKDYDTSAVDASLQNGVLTLSFSRAPEREPKKIEVKVVT